jgi:GT2 family glycosyltransferase
MPAAALIIPTLNRQAQVRKLYSFLPAQTVQDFETIIVDQSDEPDTDMAAAATDPEWALTYLHLSRKSLPNARNVGARAASSPVLIFIDDDVELAPGFIEAHLRALENPEVHAVAGRITGGYDDGPPYAEPVGVYHPLTGRVSRNFHREHQRENLGQLPGGNFSVRREVYVGVGGFDSLGFGGRSSIGEETDFACRLVEAGKRIDFEPAAHLIHLHLSAGGCRDASLARWTYWHGHNQALLSRRHAPFWAWVPFMAVAGLRYLAHTIRHRHAGLVFSGIAGTVAGFIAGPRFAPFSGGPTADTSAAS